MPSPKLTDRIGETTTANCGMEMTIIAYRSVKDIDVRFEDGQEVHHKTYQGFKKGAIAPPQDPRYKERIGETTTATCGMKMTIIAYRSILDIDVRFEDGQEVYHKAYSSFKKGAIAPPKNRIGETAVANCGMEMTIIAYRGCNDIDVRFEDGQEVHHKTYQRFKNGEIAPLRDLQKERIGETTTANCGMKMTIIGYRSVKDVDVRFEDGQEVYHKQYGCFKKGTIAPPRDPRKERVGETATASCGMKMTIIAYRSFADLDVRFEDGQEVHHKTYQCFKSGNISHPQFNMKKKAKYKTLTTQSIGRIPTGEVYFIAKCTRCGEVYAGTPQMIIAANHKCKEKNCAKPKTH